MTETATILFPYAGKSNYAELAIESMITGSRTRLGLVMTVEPGLAESDRQWVAGLSGRWPGPLKIIHNPRRLGAYGSTNETIRQCPTEIGIWFTTDQVAAPGWDEVLLKYLKKGRIVTGRLIESGATLIGDRTLWKRFGMTPETFDRKAFLSFCASFQPEQDLDVPRHYIPMAFYIEDMVRAGLFVEGRESKGLSSYRSDLQFFLHCLELGIELVEAQRCLTYHFQSGSRRKGRTLGGWLNWIYPLGLRPLHRRLTGYTAMVDILEQHGVRQQVERIRREVRSAPIPASENP